MNCPFNRALSVGASFICCFLALAQPAVDRAVQVTARAEENPARIELSWLPDSNATSYTVFRKLKEETAWDAGVVLPGTATNYSDLEVQDGDAFEYHVRKIASGYGGNGYIYAGYRAPLVEHRGKLILVIEESLVSELAFELERLELDLTGDGWTVLRHDVPRMAVDPAAKDPESAAARLSELTNLKQLIRSRYDEDPAQVKAVFLLGHLPVPYSGAIAPDNHYDHSGAWPADVYWGDMNGTWTDSQAVDIAASNPRNHNLRGDGKFDQSFLPASVTLQVGRVDLANLPSFQKGEIELLRQYLNKNHDYRRGAVAVERRGLIDDHLGFLEGEVPAVVGWRTFPSFFGVEAVEADDWLPALNRGTYLWGYGCGGGTYTSAAGIATTAELAASDPGVVFTMLFGSYFGDWDTPDNLLRAALATPTYTLTSAWSCRPHWIIHHMGLGETIGFSARLTQNNASVYQGNTATRNIHIALMGDPTLRMHVVAPVAGLTVESNGSGGAILSWTDSLDSVPGYHIYKSAAAAGPFNRVNADLVDGTTFTDPDSPIPTVYMVRAVKLEVSASGSYFNASRGTFQQYTPPALPVLTIGASNANKVYGAAMPPLVPYYEGFVNGDTPASLTSPPVLTTSATESSPVGSYPIFVGGAQSSAYTFQYLEGTLTVLPAETSGIIESSSNPARPGEEIAFTFALNAIAPGQGTPTGTVGFRVDDLVADSPTLSSGAAVFITSSLAHGFHTVVAEYPGDGNYTGTTNQLAVAQLVNTPPVVGTDTLIRDGTNRVEIAIATLLSNDSDADGDSILFSGVSPSSTNGGTVVVIDDRLVYTPPPGSTNADHFAYSISDGLGQPESGTVEIGVRVDPGPPPNLAVAMLADGSVLILGDGDPGRSYRIQSTDDLGIIDWQDLGSAPADDSGIFSITDSNRVRQRFYRSIHP